MKWLVDKSALIKPSCFDKVWLYVYDVSTVKCRKSFKAVGNLIIQGPRYEKQIASRKRKNYLLCFFFVALDYQVKDHYDIQIE